MVPGIGPAQSSAVNRWYRETQVQDNRGLDRSTSNSLRHGRFASHIFYTLNNSLQHYVPKGNLPNQSSPAQPKDPTRVSPRHHVTKHGGRAAPRECIICAGIAPSKDCGIGPPVIRALHEGGHLDAVIPDYALFIKHAIKQAAKARTSTPTKAGQRRPHAALFAPPPLEETCSADQIEPS